MGPIRLATSQGNDEWLVSIDCVKQAISEILSTPSDNKDNAEYTAPAETRYFEMDEAPFSKIAPTGQEKCSMTKIGWLVICFLLTASVAIAGRPVPNYKSWDNYPKTPRIESGLVKKLMVAGEKMVFVYAGYKTETVICGSLYLPYTAVPPNGDGSKVNLKIPKNTWIMVY